MNVAVLGTGSVGQVLGSALVELGHTVMMGSRDPSQERVQQWVDSTASKGLAGTFEQAAAFGDLVVIATVWSGTENALRLSGLENLAEKVTIDVTNPVEFESSNLPVLAIDVSDSAGERIQRWLPQSRVVKAFNTVGYKHMVHPEFPGGPPDMFICGNDVDAKALVTGFLEDLGWSVIDIGLIQGSRLLESLAMIGMAISSATQHSNYAFKLLRK